jgi:hypothetical protein
MDQTAMMTTAEIEAANTINVAETKAGGQLIWILNGFGDGFNSFNYHGTGPVPEIYVRDRYPYQEVNKLPFVRTYTQAIRHFFNHRKGGQRIPTAGPVQVPVKLLHEFGFTRKQIAEALATFEPLVTSRQTLIKELLKVAG